jgi:monothiol glutaredoxin
MSPSPSTLDPGACCDPKSVSPRSRHPRSYIQKAVELQTSESSKDAIPAGKPGNWRLPTRRLVAHSGLNSLILKKKSFEPMSMPKIIAYLKPTCGWSQGVRAVLRKHDLAYEDRDIINDRAQRQEMMEKSGQTLSPCVEVNGRLLADVSGEEVEAYLLSEGLVQPNSRVPDAPISQSCAK